MTYVRQIGPIPGWIKALRAPGYRNIFELCDPPSLFGTEHMLGDWSGELLLLAKDFAPASEAMCLLQDGLPAERVYRHNDGDGRYRTGEKTNRKLLDLLYRDRSLIDGRISGKCRAVYASACFFLKEGETSDGLRDWKIGMPAFEGSLKLVNHVVACMPRLRGIVCLGKDALSLVAVREGFLPPSRLRDGIGRRFGDQVPVYLAPHPSRGSNHLHELAWSFIRNDSGLDWIGHPLNDV